MTLFKLLTGTQASYTLLTAMWSLLDIESFMAVTGPKHDIWLVKTVGALLIPVALCLYTHLLPGTHPLPAIVLGSDTAAAFITIDLYYALSDTISNIYLLDAALEVVFLTGWVIIGVRQTSHKKRRVRD